MRYFILITLLLCTILSLPAESVPLRQACNLDWRAKQVRTSDSYEIVVWQDTASGDEDIYAQKLNPSGQTVWTEPAVISNVTALEYIFDVIPASDGNYIVLWGCRFYRGSSQIRAQKISSEGQKLWPDEGIIVVSDESYYYYVSALPNAVGGFFLVFSASNPENMIKGQNLDGSGNLLWGTSSRELFTHTDRVELDGLVKDGNGGIIVNIRKRTSIVDFSNHLLHLSAEGLVIGANPMLAQSPFSTNEYNILPLNDGNYVLYYNNTNGNCELKLQKMDLNGNLLLANPVLYNLGYNTGVELQISVFPDNRLLATWETFNYPETYMLKFQKFDSDLSPAWQGGALQMFGTHSVSCKHSVAINNLGSVWVFWQGRTQFFSPSGTVGFPYDGLLISDQGTDSPLCLASEDRAVFIWREISNQQQSIRRQTVTESGSVLLPAGGSAIVARTDGTGSYAKVFTLENRFITIWKDDRQSTYVYKIYYQILSPELVPLLEEGGRALNLSGGNVEYFHAAVALPGNSLAIIYTTWIGSTLYSYLQVIEQSGDLLYPGNGILFTTETSTVQSFMLSYSEGDFYIGWRRYSVNSPIEMVGQRVSGGIVQWGNSGKVLASFPNNNGSSLRGLQGQYYSWNAQEGTNYTARVMKVDQNGNPAPGWQTPGLAVLSLPESYSYSHEYSGLLGENLAVIVRKYNSVSYQNLAQLISPSGQRLWLESGIEVFPLQQNCVIKDVVFDDQISLIYSSTELRLQQISENGVLLCGSLGLPIESGLIGSYEAKLVQYDNKAFSCFISGRTSSTTTDSDLYYQQINASGIPLNDNIQLLCDAPYAQNAINAASLGNKSLLVWNDERAKLYNSSLSYPSIYAAGIDAAVDVSEQFIGYSPTLLLRNYPNPFNPSTIISFNLPNPQKVNLEIYNIRGQLLRRLYHDAFLGTGKHDIVWDGRDENGSVASSGVYLCKLVQGNKQSVRKMLLSK